MVQWGALLRRPPYYSLAEPDTVAPADDAVGPRLLRISGGKERALPLTGRPDASPGDHPPSGSLTFRCPSTRSCLLSPEGFSLEGRPIQVFPKVRLVQFSEGPATEDDAPHGACQNHEIQPHRPV